MAVRQRTKSPYWWYDFWHRGRRYRGSTRHTSKLRAKEYERRLINQLETGRGPSASWPDVNELLSRYLPWLELNRTVQHADRSRRAIKNVLDRMRGVRTADDIRPSKIEEFKRRRLTEVSSSTVNLELRHLKAFLKRCVKQGWLPHVPVEIEQVRTPGRGRVIFLSENEINPFLDKLNPWGRDAARFILLTGLRLEEARFLEWQDVDLEAGELWVRNKPELGFSSKNGKERVVALPPRVGGRAPGEAEQVRLGAPRRKRWSAEQVDLPWCPGCGRAKGRPREENYSSRLEAHVRQSLSHERGGHSDRQRPHGALEHHHDRDLSAHRPEAPTRGGGQTKAARAERGRREGNSISTIGLAVGIPLGFTTSPRRSPSPTVHGTNWSEEPGRPVRRFPELPSLATKSVAERR